MGALPVPISQMEEGGSEKVARGFIVLKERRRDLQPGPTRDLHRPTSPAEPPGSGPTSPLPSLVPAPAVCLGRAQSPLTVPISVLLTVPGTSGHRTSQPASLGGTEPNSGPCASTPSACPFWGGGGKGPCFFISYYINYFKNNFISQ